jgi:ECF transporter S component (folate family)
MRNNKKTMDIRTIVKAGFLVAISIVMTRFAFVMLPIAGVSALRISFGEMPLMLSGFLFGPLVGGLTGIAADLLGVLINPQGPYYPGFTISSMMWGILPGIITYILEKKVPISKMFSFKFVLVSVAISSIIVTLLNTVWLSDLFGTAIIILLPPRLLSAAISIPILSILLTAILKYARRFM